MGCQMDTRSWDERTFIGMGPIKWLSPLVTAAHDSRLPTKGTKPFKIQLGARNPIQKQEPMASKGPLVLDSCGPSDERALRGGWAAMNVHARFIQH